MGRIQKAAGYGSRVNFMNTAENNSTEQGSFGGLSLLAFNRKRAATMYERAWGWVQTLNKHELCPKPASSGVGRG